MNSHGIEIEVVLGDITEQPDIDAVVNAANAILMSGGGVCGAIFRKAGPELIGACQALAPVDVGNAVATPGFGMPNSHVIHAVGPRYGKDHPEETLLADAYRNALKEADSIGARSIAFPAISAGIYGYPLAEASEVAVRAVAAEIPELLNVRLIRFVMFDEDALTHFSTAVEEFFA